MRSRSRAADRRRGWLVAALVTLIPLLSPALDASAQSDVNLEYRTGRSQRIRLLQESFSAEGDRNAKAYAVQTDGTLYSDLDLSGYFHVTRGWAKDERPFDVQAIIEGKLSLQGSQVTLTGEIKDFPARRIIGRSTQRGTLPELRRLVHRIADDLVYQLTGERGVAETRIAFVSGGRGKRELYVMDLDGYGAQKLTSGGVCVSPAWSPDGNRIAYSYLHDTGWGLYQVAPTGGASTYLWTRGGLNIAPRYSPDGTLVAFSSSYEGNSEIYTMPAAGGPARRLTKNNSIDTSPSWSPTGQQLTFVSDRTGKAQVYVMDADGANARRLVYGYDYTDSPDWSPRGDRIAFVVRTGGGFDIYVVDVQGQDPRLVVGGGSNENPRWSPDGRHLVFSSNRGGNWGLYIASADGLSVRRLPTPGSEAKSPAWSPRLGPPATALGAR